MLLEMTRMMMFGEWMKRRRAELGISQQDLADRMNTYTNKISRWELNHNKRLPEPGELERWATALEATPEEILAAVGYLKTERLDSPALMFTQLTQEIEQFDEISPALRRVLLGTLRAAREEYERGHGEA